MSNFSYWEARYFWHPADYLIVGGGITGLATAITLIKNRPKSRVVVLERGPIPAGASTKNAGFACFGSASEIIDDLNNGDETAVFELIERRYAGLQRLRELLTDQDTGYEPCGGFEIFLEGDLASHRQCVDALPHLNEQLRQIPHLQPFELADRHISTQGFEGVKHMIVNRSEGLIDTGLMMKNLSALARQLGVDILTGVEVHHIDDSREMLELVTSHGTLKAGKVCVATNGFAKRLLPHLGVNPCRAQVMVTSPITDLQVHGAFHHHGGFDYFRHIHGRILLGGGRHLDLAGEQTDVFGTSQAIQTYLEKLLFKVIVPHKPVEIAQRWSGIMGMGADKSLILSEVSPRVFCAVRFGGMGIALGSDAGYRAAGLMLA